MNLRLDLSFSTRCFVVWIVDEPFALTFSMNIAFEVCAFENKFHKSFYNVIFVLLQVTLIAASSYSRLMQQNEEQVFADWLWEVMLLLHLHDNDQPVPVNGHRSRSGAMSRDKGMQEYLLLFLINVSVIISVRN